MMSTKAHTNGKATLEENIAITKIKLPPNAMRSAYDNDALSELADNIKRIGLINAITVRPVRDGFEIVAGCRRYMAHEKLGEIFIRCVVVKGDAERNSLLMFSENLMREDVNPVDQATAFTEYMKRFKVKQRELAKLIGKSEAYISQRIDLLKYPPEILKRVREGIFNVSVAREFARITDYDYLGSCIAMAVSGGITPKQAKRWADDWVASKTHHKTQEEVIQNLRANAPVMELKVKCEHCGTMKLIEQTENVRICKKCLEA